MRQRWLVVGLLLSAALGLVTNLATGALHLPAAATPWLWLAVAVIVALSVLVGRRAAGETDAVPAGEPEQVAQRLAESFGAQWRHEEEIRRINDPFPLPVRWRAGPPELTDHWANIRRARPGDDPGPLRVGGSVRAVARLYRRIPSGRLVVLGGAGAGKSVLALRLVSDLLAGRDPADLVPVVLEVRQWDPRVTTFDDWLAARLILQRPALAAPGPLGGTVAATLVGGGRILPILDGFDEIAAGLRAAVLRALGASTRPLVLLSRPDEYAAAVAGAGVLSAAAVIQIGDLRPADLADYLPRTTRRRADRAGWDAVLDAMRDRPDDEAIAHLIAALRTPLMVSLARIVFSDAAGRDPAELLDTDRFPGTVDIEEHLIAEFLSAAFHPAGSAVARRRDPERVRRWLGHLARHTVVRGTPDIAWWRLSTAVPWYAQALAAVVLVGPLVAVVDGPLAGLVTAALAAVVGGFGARHELDPTDVRLRLRGGLRRILSRFAVGGAGGFLGGALLGLILFLALGGGDAAPAVGVPLLFGLIGAALGALYGVVRSVVRVETTGIDVGSAAGPLTVLRRDRRNALLAAAVLALVVGGRLRDTGIGSASAAAFLLACYAWAWGRWVVLTRGLLPLTGRLPWALPGFLEEAHRRGVLRQSGAMYQFRHVRLRDHLAAADDNL